VRRNLLETAFVLAVLAIVALGGYELTAKSPRLLGQALPGWVQTARVERSVPWQPHTHILPLDKVVHECREAWLYYEMITGLADSRRDPTSRLS